MSNPRCDHPADEQRSTIDVGSPTPPGGPRFPPSSRSGTVIEPDNLLSQSIMPPTLEFQQIRIGQHFEFRGRRYQKLALSLAGDEDRYGNIFQAQTEVLPDPFPQRPTSEITGSASAAAPGSRGDPSGSRG